jgi:carbon-monoxide dehydrogenase iron sulfur subunit
MAVPRIKVGCGPSERSRSQVGDLEDVCSRANLRQVFVVLCQHCDGPECVGACTAGALTKDPDGAVRHHPELCTGCLECIAVCPFSAIYDNKAGNNVVKCDLCGGKGIPSCIEACMVDALYLE